MTEQGPARPFVLHPAREPGSGALVLRLPGARALVKHVLPSVLEGVVGPFVVFYAVLSLAGFEGALYGALGWSGLALARRLALRQRVPATLLLGILLLSARTVVALVTGSALLYFLQPTLGTVAVGIAFLASAFAKRPFIERLAHDFCPFSPELLARAGMRRFFNRLSLLWASVMLTNAAVVLALLLTSSLRAFVVERTAVSWTLSALAIACSVLIFRRALRHEGIHLRLGSRPLAVPAGSEGTRHAEETAAIA